ncbi:MAG: hypothetical protein J1E42_07935 [Akkermansiaceae bacterium]|nr:hypothetical protein [Akkermansiaceae bacterium]
MKLRISAVSALCCTLALWPACSALEESEPPADMRENAPPPSSLDALFDELITEASSIHHLLNEVADKDSADRVAAQLETRLAHMNSKLGELEQLPPDESETGALQRHMTTLTHASQLYLTAMQRLAELNAYGSTALMGVFRRYKVDAVGSQPHLQADDLPHSPLYTELADTLEDALFTLRHVQDEASAQAAAQKIASLLQQMERAHDMLTQLAPLRTDEQKEAVRPARERVRRITDAIKEQTSRLKEAHYYNTPALDLLLPKLLPYSAS